MLIHKSEQSRSRGPVLLLVSSNREIFGNVDASVDSSSSWRIERVRDGAAALPFCNASFSGLVLANAFLPEPGPSGFDLCRALYRAGSAAGAILLLPQPSLEDRLAAFDAAADDCMEPPFDARELVARANALARRTGLCEPFPKPLVLSTPKLSNGSSVTVRAEALGHRYRLSRRERQILTLLAEGTELKAIGSQIGCSYSSVRTHLRRMARKIGCTTTREILIRFFRHELDTPEFGAADARTGSIA